MSNLTPTPIVDKNGRQTTVHKNLNAGTTDARAAAVGAPVAAGVAKTSNEGYLDAVDALIQDYMGSGMLAPTRSMNGGKRFTTGEILIGRDDEDSRIYVKIELEHSDKPRRTTELEDVKEAWEISFTGTIKTKGMRDGGGGQIQDSLADVQTGIGSEAADELSQLWKKNHLNSLNSGTEAQSAKVREILAASGERYDFGKLSPQIEDDRGYRYGSGWLHKEVPIEDIDRALEILQEATSLVIK